MWLNHELFNNHTEYKVNYEKLPLDDKFNPIGLEGYPEPIVIVTNYSYMCHMDLGFPDTVKSGKADYLNTITKIHCKAGLASQLVEQLVSSCSYYAVALNAWSDLILEKLHRVPKEKFAPSKPSPEPVEFTGEIIYE